jgi:hypothetical protein
VKMRLYHIRNENIRKQLKIESVRITIDEYRQNWINHLDRTTDAANAETDSTLYTEMTPRPWKR